MSNLGRRAFFGAVAGVAGLLGMTKEQAAAAVCDKALMQVLFANLNLDGDGTTRRQPSYMVRSSSLEAYNLDGSIIIPRGSALLLTIIKP
ncbi:MAG: hypothetical protein KGL39_06765 [Patescibacteria group bacterium]|nr:hypothetical protein [Patescibacteria group bacterium]